MTNKVKQLREGRGLTQQQLADALGVSRQTIIAIEKGKYNPSLQLALQMSGYLGKAVEEVFFL